MSGTVRHTSTTYSMGRASGHGQQVYYPSGRRHGGLEFDQKVPSDLHAGGAGPPLSGVVSGKNIKQRIPLGGLKSAISGRIAVAGVQGPNQMLVFLGDNTQKEVERRRDMALFQFQAAARQCGRQ